MTAKRVEWVLVIRFGSSAHRATYGRLPGTTFSKDFIQLSRKKGFIEELESVFPSLEDDGGRASLTYEWPGGSAAGMLVKHSSDRPHLSWVTAEGAPPPWKMTQAPTERTVETIRGNPNHRDAADADAELARLESSGFGQPFLVAVKLEGEAATLHLRVHIQNPTSQFGWADLQGAPTKIQDLAGRTTERSVLASRLFGAGEGVYFEPESKARPWRNRPANSFTKNVGDQLSAPVVAAQALELNSDSIAESLDHSEKEVSELEEQVEGGDYKVPDATATVKTRGSAQRVFSQNVKKNYGWRCAVTGIETRAFLIASHIVPWSADEEIRLDPANGICLSVLVDRAFENGYVVVEDNLTVRVDWGLVGKDKRLAEQLADFDGVKLAAPNSHPPKTDYLKRRRSMPGATISG